MDFNVLPTKEIILQTITAVNQRNISAYFVEDKDAALQKIKELLPAGAEIMTGSSKTL